MPAAYQREVTHLQIDRIWIDCSVRESHGMSAQCTQFPVEDGPNVSDHVRTAPETLHLEGIVTNTPLDAPKSHTEGLVFDDKSSYALRDAHGQKITTTFDQYVSKTIEGEPVGAWLSVLPFVGQVSDLTRRGSDPRWPKVKLAMERAQPRNILNNLSMTAPQMLISTAAARSGDPSASASVDRVGAVAAALRDSFARRRPVQVVTAYRVYQNAVMVELSVTRDASGSRNALMFTAQCQMVNVVGVTYGTPLPAQVRATPAKAKGTQNTQPTKPGEISPDQKKKTTLFKQAITAAKEKLENLNSTP
ncbi:MAG TPA: hypothetical protein VNG33_11145 [Polyangiaceae bacterium]|nr:hypothetical protein [Polyangiaceae bacterium]